MQGSGIEVRKDGGDPVGSERNCLNLKQGTNVTITITDNPATNCLDVEFASSGGGGEPHAIGGASHTASTLAELNTKLSDATLDKNTDARPPTAHGHAQSDVLNLVDDLAAKETPGGAQAKVDAHANLTTTAHGGLIASSEKAAASGIASLNASSKVVQDCANPQTPASHSHAESEVTNLTTDLAAKVVVAGQIGGTPSSPTVIGLRETSGPTLLELGSIADGQYGKRVGSTFVGGIPTAVVSNPWDGILNASYADGNPGRALDRINDILNTVAGPTPTGIGSTVARCVLFKLSAAITTAKIRLFPVAAVANLYKFAIYPKAVGSARLWESGLVSTTANTWLNISAVVTLAANTEYWWCVTTTSTGTTAAFRTPAAPLHSAFFGASVAPLGARNLGLPEYAQFAVTAGAFPATLPSIVAAAYGAGSTGTVPIAFFDSVS